MNNNKKYNPEKDWTKNYLKRENIAFPAEGVVRIFKGKFPTLNLPHIIKGQNILDLGCGDGRHIKFLNDCGLKVFGTEITDEICLKVSEDLKKYELDIKISKGKSEDIPFENAFFDFLLTWNSCYYMSAGHSSFEDHVKEMSRVLKNNGWIVCSVPKKTNFIFDKSVKANRDGYRTIKSDFFGHRDGEIMRCFENYKDLEKSFSSDFKNFCHSDISMDWFGLNYHWHVIVAQKN